MDGNINQGDNDEEVGAGGDGGPGMPGDAGGLGAGADSLTSIEKVVGDLRMKKFPVYYTVKGDPTTGAREVYAASTTVTLKVDAQLVVKASVSGTGRIVGVLVRDSEGNQLNDGGKVTKGALRSVETTIPEVSATGKYTITVFSNRIGKYNMEAFTNKPSPSDTRRLSTSADEAALKKRIDDLERRVKALENKLKKLSD